MSVAPILASHEADEAMRLMMIGRPDPRRVYRATHRRDVMDLAFTLENTPEALRPTVAAFVVQRGLMVGPWWFRMLVGAINRNRPAVAIAKLRGFYVRLPNEAAHLITETARHMRHGKDREDADSVGGFSQREFDLIVAVLKMVASKEAAS